MLHARVACELDDAMLQRDLHRLIIALEKDRNKGSHKLLPHFHREPVYAVQSMKRKRTLHSTLRPSFSEWIAAAVTRAETVDVGHIAFDSQLWPHPRKAGRDYTTTTARATLRSLQESPSMCVHSATTINRQPTCKLSFSSSLLKTPSFPIVPLKLLF